MRFSVVCENLTGFSSGVAVHLLRLATVYICLFAGVSAQEIPSENSPVNIDTVRILADRPILSELDLASTVSRIQTAALPSAESLAQLLADEPGIFIRSNGGGEGVHSISMRGMDAAHTLVLLEGVPLNNLQLGTLNLGGYGLGDISEIEIYRGGLSTLFGSGAIGGVVNLRFTPPPEFRIRLETGAGAYGEHTVSASIAAPHGRWVHLLSFANTASDNGYDFSLNGGIFQRRNSDFKQQNRDYLLQYRPGDTHTLTAQILSIRNDRGAPAAVINRVDSQGSARLDDEQLLMRLKWDARFTPNQRITFQGYMRRDWMSWVDPDLVIANQALQSRHFNEQVGLSIQQQHRFSESWQMISGAEAGFTRVRSTDLSNIPTQRQGSAFALLEWLRPLGNAFLTTQGALRIESGPDFRSVLLPRGSVKLHYRSLAFFTSLGMNFRVPTYNDRYWQPGGNPNLRAERSTAFESGVSGRWRGWKMHLSYYNSYLRDMIRWQPGDNGIWHPFNLDAVRSRGLEAGLSVTPFSGISANVDFKYGLSTLSETRANPDLLGNRLAYLPSTELHFRLHVAQRGFHLGGDWIFSSHRYATIANLPVQKLPAYFLINLSGSYRIRLGDQGVDLFGSIGNLLREEYQLIRGYPLPLQTWRIGIRLNYH